MNTSELRLKARSPFPTPRERCEGSGETTGAPRAACFPQLLLSQELQPSPRPRALLHEPRAPSPPGGCEAPVPGGLPAAASSRSQRAALAGAAACALRSPTGGGDSAGGRRNSPFHTLHLPSTLPSALLLLGRSRREAPPPAPSASRSSARRGPGLPPRAPAPCPCPETPRGERGARQGRAEGEGCPQMDS